MNSGDSLFVQEEAGSRSFRFQMFFFIFFTNFDGCLKRVPFFFLIIFQLTVVMVGIMFRSVTLLCYWILKHFKTQEIRPLKWKNLYVIESEKETKCFFFYYLSVKTNEL